MKDVVGITGAEFLEQADWAEIYGEVVLSPLGAMQLCQASCRHKPEPVLDYVMAGERRAQHESKYGVSSLTPMARMGRPEEIAELVAWLTSTELSFSTGAVYDISGGRASY